MVFSETFIPQMSSCFGFIVSGGKDCKKNTCALCEPQAVRIITQFIYIAFIKSYCFFVSQTPVEALTQV